MCWLFVVEISRFQHFLKTTSLNSEVNLARPPCRSKKNHCLIRMRRSVPLRITATSSLRKSRPHRRSSTMIFPIRMLGSRMRRRPSWYVHTYIHSHTHSFISKYHHPLHHHYPILPQVSKLTYFLRTKRSSGKLTNGSSPGFPFSTSSPSWTAPISATPASLTWNETST